MRNAVQLLQSHAGCWGGRGGPFRTMPTGGGGELLSPTPNSGDSSSICTVTLGSAPSLCPSLPRAARLPAPHPSGPWNGRGGEEACAAAQAVAPSTEPARFSRVSESRCTAGCLWPKRLVRAAHDVMLTRARSGPWVCACPCPWAAQSPGWMLVTAPATQLPYKPWNATALPMLLMLQQLARKLLLKGRH